MPPRLTDTEIQQRLVRLRNLEQLYPKARKRIQVLEQENKELKAQVTMLQDQVETLQLQVEELRGMVFGKQRKEKHPDVIKKEEKRKNTPRPSSSYRRDTPTEVTTEKTYPLEHCQDCGTTLTNKKTCLRYCEDIVLPAITGERTATVEKQHIQVGYCPQCNKQCQARHIPPQRVYLGTQVKTYVHYATYILRLSYRQIQDYLKDIHDFTLSEGEIARILEEGGRYPTTPL